MKSFLLGFNFLFLLLFSSCNVLDKMEKKAAMINNYEKVALKLQKENRLLQEKITSLESNLQAEKSKNKFLEMKMAKYSSKAKRTVASISPTSTLKKDYVKNHVYNWTPSQLLAIGEKEFEEKNYEKSAQYFYTYVAMENKHKTINDKILFQAGLSAFESGRHYDWSIKLFERLQTEFPQSAFYRGAKIWTALSYFRTGDKQKLYQTVEEFRLKYRNTPEWEILRGHYEEITQKYKN